MTDQWPAGDLTPASKVSKYLSPGSHGVPFGAGAREDNAEPSLRRVRRPRQFMDRRSDRVRTERNMFCFAADSHVAMALTSAAQVQR